jgi:hypothetical protein
MKKLSIIIILCILFSLVCIQSVLGFGKKEGKKTDPGEWEDIVETTLFGLLEAGKGDTLFLQADHRIPGKAIIGGAGKKTYQITGETASKLMKKAGNYVFLRGKIKEEAGEDSSPGMGKDPGITWFLVTKILIVQKSATPNWKNTEQREIEGIVELGKDNQVCIVTNWESRSRVSYYVYGDQKNAIEKSPGSIVKAIGLVVVLENEETSFTKNIYIEKIISVKEKT